MSIIRFIVASFIACLTGFFGIIFFFADYGEGESWITRMLLALGYHFVFGGIVGSLTSPFWKFGGFVAWGVVIFGLVELMQIASGGGGENLVEVVAVMLLPLVAAFLGGKAGSFILSKIRKRKQ